MKQLMKTLKSNNSNANIFGKTYKELEKKYVAAAAPIGAASAKCVVVDSIGGVKQGAIFGYDKNGKTICANTFATYCGNEMVICVKVHKYDYLIEDALEIINKTMKARTIKNIKVGKVTYIDNTK